jgi:hypothetical protein
VLAITVVSLAVIPAVYVLGARASRGSALPSEAEAILAAERG